MGRCSYKKQIYSVVWAELPGSTSSFHKWPLTLSIKEAHQEMHAGINFLIKANLAHTHKKEENTHKKFEIRLPELKQCILKCFAMAVVFVVCFFKKIVYTMLSTLVTSKGKGIIKQSRWLQATPSSKFVLSGRKEPFWPEWYLRDHLVSS